MVTITTLTEQQDKFLEFINLSCKNRNVLLTVIFIKNMIIFNLFNILIFSSF